MAGADVAGGQAQHASRAHGRQPPAQLEDQLARAQVIDPSGSGMPPPHTVRFGVTVLLLDTESDEEVRYTIVGEHESDAASGRISG